MRLALLLALLPAAFAQPPDLQPAPGSTPPDPFTRQRFTIRSSILGENRKVTVALPASFSRTGPARRYPTAVVFDGEYLLHRVLPAAADLIRYGQIPELVFVAIENIDGFRGRVRDLTPPGLSVSGSSRQEGGDRFLDFIERELLPALDRQFRTAAPRVMLGQSSGGILATWAAATRPAFRLVVSLDAPMHLDEDWLARKLIARAGAKPPPLFYAAYAARFEWPGPRWAELTAAAPPSWKLHYQKLDRETHNSMAMLGAYLGLRQVFADYSRLSAPVYPTTSILPYYEKAGELLGAPVEPPEALLGEVVEDLLMEGRGRSARAAFERWTTGYGRPANAEALEKQIAEVERRPPPTETVESLLAAPFPTPEEAREILGEWSIEEAVSPDFRPKSELRIRVEDGKVTGESISRPAPGVELVQKLQYLKVGRDEFTYGYMNGMRPRGMILYTVARQGETWEGQMRFGGIRFERPDGMPFPRVQARKVR